MKGGTRAKEEIRECSGGADSRADLCYHCSNIKVTARGSIADRNFYYVIAIVIDVF